jgi:hypothetical protein
MVPRLLAIQPHCFLLAALLSLNCNALSPQELKHRSGASQDLPQPAVIPAAKDVLVQRTLIPALRGSAILRFSADGSRLLVQDDSGLYVAQPSPLQLLAYFEIISAYPAAFSADSQSVSVLGHNLTFVTIPLADPKNPVQRELPAKRGCLDARLSPDASWIACMTPDFTIDLYRASDLQLVYSQKSERSIPSGIKVPVPMRRDSPFSTPFGFIAAHGFDSLANSGRFRMALTFSPDARFFLTDEESNFCRVDLPSLVKRNLPGSLHKHPRGIVGVLSSGDAVLVSEGKTTTGPKKDPEQKEIISLSSGKTLARISYDADVASVATNRRYAMLAKFAYPSLTPFDLEKKAPLSVASNLGADIWQDQLALLDGDGDLRIYRLGEQQPIARGRLPLGPLHSLYSALPDSSLSTLALSLHGAGATYDLKSGERIESLRSFRGANFSSADDAFLQIEDFSKSVPGVSHWLKKQQSASKDSPDWLAEKTLDLMSSRNAFVAYSFYNFINRDYPMIGLKGEIPFELHAHDPATGRELWRHRYDQSSPLPFADPQGARIVLGWQANTDAAHSVAKRFPAARDAYKKQKVKAMDTFFEVLDVSTGASLGGVLVQFGSGPEGFDSVLSGGDLLFLSKDNYRLSVFQINEGKLLARLRGEHPTITELGKMFALDEGGGRVSIYSLLTAKRLALRPLPDLVAYMSFSQSGDRLLVLTIHQQLLVLDVAKTIENFPAPVSTDAESPAAEPGP